MPYNNSNNRLDDFRNVEIKIGKWNNFTGEKRPIGKTGKYTQPGKRYFKIVLSEELAQTLIAEGYRESSGGIQFVPAIEEGNRDQWILQVNIAYSERSTPDIAIENSRGNIIPYTEHDVDKLQTTALGPSDIVVRRYYGDDGKCSAYLQGAIFRLSESTSDLLDEIRRRSTAKVEEEDEMPFPMD